MIEDRYSNFTEGFFKAQVLGVIGLSYGIFALYRKGQGSNKPFQIFSSALATALILGMATKNMRKINITGKSQQNKYKERIAV